MCQDCGCLENAQPPQQAISKGKEISIKQNILQKNKHIAEHNREHFGRTKTLCTNWISAPGSGKTSVLERLIHDNKETEKISVIEGDQQTDNDASRIRSAGAHAVQINTGAGCHLDAQMVHQALHELDLSPGSLLMIENVGNMVCPTAYDLGEHFKIAMISCTEGDDKPLKYPDLLLTAKVLLLNKMDLLPYLDFDVEACVASAQKVNPALVIFPISAKTGEGMEAFYDYLKEQQSSSKIS